MPRPRVLSTPAVLAPCAIGARRVEACFLGIAKRDTGYRASGASPVGTCGKLPVHVERPIRDWSRLYLNLGGRGFLVHIGPQAIARLLGAALARAAVVR